MPCDYRGYIFSKLFSPECFQNYINIFPNDLFYIDTNRKIANYADDNHLYHANDCAISLKDAL